MGGNVSIPNYEIKEKIYAGIRTVIYKAVRKDDNLPVILKTCLEEHPSENTIARLEHEKHLYSKWLSTIDNRFVSYFRLGNKRFLVFLDDGELPISEYFETNPPTIHFFLEVAIKITEFLSKVHQLGIIHKDIKPENILIHPQTHEVKLIDFGIATQLAQEIQEIRNPSVIEGSLAYIAPEQTGRMNRNVDYRTDFYSLGIFFYEVLTGNLPYTAGDSIELIHKHIAVTPPSPCEVKPTVPLVISDIVMKLISKTAEERYQSEYGLKYDLETCLLQLNTTGNIQAFPIGQKDISSTLHISQKIYGREKELESLLNIFEQFNQGKPELFLISGYSGIGKSSFVHELLKPLFEKRGYFIAGKYEQFQREMPYKAFIQAFQQMVQQILTEDDRRIALWKEKLLGALEQNGQVLIDIIPNLELIIGPQPSLPFLGAKGNQNRFSMAMRNFVHALSSQDHPLIISIDDLQWADLSSLKLLETLLSDSESKYLYIISAYRDNEVNEFHPLTFSLEEIKKKKVNIHSLHLSSLSLKNVSELIADSLQTTLEKVKTLSILCYDKTLGNPFFLNQFLQTLYSEKLLVFNPRQGCWEWSIEEIENKGITNNVIELMTDKIKKLPKDVQQILQLASCMGSCFDLKNLEIVQNSDSVNTAELLWTAVQERLIVPIGNSYKYIESDHAAVVYRFLHDRVQQAAYSMMDEEHQKYTHLKIARLTLKNFTSIELETSVYEVINHYIPALSLVESSEEKDRIIELALMAGKKAKASNAFEAAFDYLKQGTALLKADCWETQYAKTLELYTEQAEASFLCGNFNLMDESVSYILKNAAHSLEKVKAVEIKITGLISRRDLKGAIEAGIDFMGELGLKFPKKTNYYANLFQLIKIKFLMGNKTVSSLINLPPMHDPAKQAAIRIALLIRGAVYRYSPIMLPRIFSVCVQQCILYGNTESAPYLYATHASILCGIVRDIDAGFAFGELSLNMVNMLPNTKMVTPIVLFCYGIFINHWKSHLRDAFQVLVSAAQKSIEIRNLEITAYSLLAYGIAQFQACDRLQDVENSISKSLPIIKHTQQADVYQYLMGFYISVTNLLGQSKNPGEIIREDFNINDLLKQAVQRNDRAGLFISCVNKMILHYLFHDYAKAYETAEIGRSVIDAALSHILEPIFFFYDSLIRLAFLPFQSNGRWKGSLKIVKQNQKLMKKWSEHAPMNYLHRYHMVQAELAYLDNDDNKAIKSYDTAIELAQKNEYVREEALAYELAGSYHLRKKNFRLAKSYLNEALYSYRSWGAAAKVDHLQHKYPELLFVEKSKVPIRATIHTKTGETIITDTSLLHSANLDIITVMKASQAISEEIQLSKLIAKLLQIVIENTGAEKGVLFIAKGDKLVLEGEMVKNETKHLLESIPLENVESVPQTLILYVYRTRELIVLGDATNQGNFQQDVYILQKHPKSVLCVPIVYQKKIVGIFYCENNQSTDTFTDDRNELLRLLSSQIGISIQNATLFNELEMVKKNLEDYSQNLEQKVVQRTSELQTKNLQLEDAIAKLQSMQKQIIQQEKLAGLGLISQGISHEIQNPLNFVINFAEVATDYVKELNEVVKEKLKGEEGEEIADDLEGLGEAVNHISENGRRISTIVKSMQEHAKTGAEEKERTEICPLILGAVDLIKYNYAHKYPDFNVELIADFDKSAQTVFCFPGHLRRALCNIIDNAYYAMYEKSKIIKKSAYIPLIKVGTKKVQEHTQIIISDNGTGISKENLEKITVPFFTTKPTGGGNLGLGLSIANDIIVQEHGGELTLHSDEGVSTEVVITL